MENYDFFKDILMRTKIAQMPQNNIATFGKTTYDYYFLGKINQDMTHLCFGSLSVNNPLFITPFSNQDLIAGFTKKMELNFNKFIEELNISDSVLVDYKFKNTTLKEWQQKTPLPEALAEIKEKSNNNPMTTIFIGEKNFWEPALFKFCLKLIEKSLPHNISEIEERGFLNQHGLPPKMLEEIDRRFEKAKKNKSEANKLGNFLVENDIFNLYEERFFETLTESKKSNTT